MEQHEEKTETAENQKVYYLVIEHIKSLAQEGKISFGSKLPSERELMATLGLSRNSVREALRSLENMGIIESRHGQGNYLVNNVGKSLNSVFSMLLFTKQSDYIEISQLRRFIEIGAYLLSVRHAGEEDLRRLAFLLDRIDKCSAEDRANSDKQFHDELIKISGNQLLGILNEALSDMFERVIKDLSVRVEPEEWGRLRECHKRVYENLCKRDVQEGIKAIREHYNVIDKELEAFAERKRTE